MNELFVVTGGGTGAKVAEAMVHLAAAGVAPEKVHLLLIDSDAANGNLARAVSTAESYSTLQAREWAVDAKVKTGLFSSSTVGLRLFKSEVRLSQLTRSIESVLDGGLEKAADTQELRWILDLLYDKEEQEARCDDGFRARPNLGCLLLADHLNSYLASSAQGFLDALRSSLRRGQPVPIVVVASVFGGTGASLLPIARRSIESALVTDGNRSVLDNLAWGAVKMLPHYQPTRRKASVDPGRFMLDSAGALQFYSKVYANPDATQVYDSVYLVGSDDPGRNQVKPQLGSSDQANPAYFEELAAALAALHFARERGRANKAHVYAPTTIRWRNLPGAELLGLDERLAYLMHLGSFLLRRNRSGSSTQLDQGILGLLRNNESSAIQAHPWYEKLLDRWAKEHIQSYENAPEDRRFEMLLSPSELGDHSIGTTQPAMAEYFGRLLLWASTALPEELLQFTDSTYQVLYERMSEVKPQEIEVEGSQEADNALVRAARGALAAMVREHQKKLGGKVAGDGFVLLDAEERIPIRISPRQLEDSLEALGLHRVVDEFRRTMVHV